MRHRTARRMLGGVLILALTIGWCDKLRAQEAAPEVPPAPTAFQQFESKLNDVAGTVAGAIAKVFFLPIPTGFSNPDGSSATFPLVVGWLVVGALFCTIRLKFLNIRGFWHAIMLTTGKYDKPGSEGEVSHFQALAAALSATVGLGNIAGVTTAICAGGPGAAFWMIVAGFLGMSSKCMECTLGQKFREVRPDGRIMGGAMYYLSRGFAQLGVRPLGQVLAVMFAIMCVFASFGGGNAYQVNQSLDAVNEVVPILKVHPWAYGLVMTVMTGIVIIGGIRRIATAAEKIVPTMCGVYILTCTAIVVMHAAHVPAAFAEIFKQAFTPEAVFGGTLGVIVQGFRRAAFSNEAGVGSAAIAHSAAKTAYPIREGFVALLEPFIDTIIVCTMTALMIVVTDAYKNPEYQQMAQNGRGAPITTFVMGDQWKIPVGAEIVDGEKVIVEVKPLQYVLALSVALFAFSTMISWSYYGERCCVFLLGERASLPYKIVFLICSFLGSIVSAANVLDLSDLMILGMAFPNVIGLFCLSGFVVRDLNDYWARYKAGEFDQPA